ncbi:MAG: tyrosine-type recombinase/integrase [Solirubrobacteraceae bacterium]
MSTAPLRLVAAEPVWRVALKAAIRPEFRVDAYEPDPDDPWLYGPHCAVGGCELPICRPLNGRGGVYVCNGHLHNYRDHGPRDVQAWLAGAGPLRAQRRRRPSYRLVVGGPLELELRYGLQCWHDGHHAVVLGGGQWSGLLRHLERAKVSSVLDLDAARIRAEFGNRGEVSFMRRVVDRFRRAELGLDDRHADVWEREVYEQFGAGHRRVPVRMDFTLIERPWLREVVKEVTWVRMARQGVGPTSAYRTLMHVAHFERWAGLRLDPGPEAIDRRLLEDYLTHVRGLPYSAAEREHRLVSLDAMLSLARALEIESFTASACYLRGELAQRTGRRLPRFYDEHVAAQFDDPANRARLTDPAARIGFLVMRHAGLRISSACSLKLDCLAADPGGQPWLMYLDHKGDEEDLVPISTEIAEEIRSQQRRVRERFPSTPWLLPAERANRDGQKHLCDSEIRRRLRRWVLECDICEQSGRPIEFKPHRFRHTIATELINRGMSRTGIQRFLSHDSGAMTDVYAHMLDQTLKQEWLATKERVNAASERVALTTPLIDDDAAWLKHQLARAKQTLPDGECGLPIQQNCPHPNACHSCPHFLTDERYRPVLEEQLTRAEQRVADAEHAGHERLAEINRPDVLDLRRIIAGLDRLGG